MRKRKRIKSRKRKTKKKFMFTVDRRLTDSGMEELNDTRAYLYYKSVGRDPNPYDCDYGPHLID